MLLLAGADRTIRDNDGRTPLDAVSRAFHATLHADLVEPHRSRALFKARALLDAAYATRKARTDARAKGHPAAVQQQEAIAAAPVYLKQRLAQAQGLPRVSILLHDDDEEEKLMACVKYALGFEGGGGVVLEWQEEPAVGMLPEVFVELLELLVPKWDPAQKGRPLGEGYIEVEEEEEEKEEDEDKDA